VVLWTRRADAASCAAQRRWSCSGCAPPSSKSRCGRRMRHLGRLSAVTAAAEAPFATAVASENFEGGRGRHIDVGSRTCSSQESELG